MSTKSLYLKTTKRHFIFNIYVNELVLIHHVIFLRYIGGHAESRACVTEALTTALACLDELGRTDVPMHVILLCCSPPYSAYAGGLVPPGKHLLYT